MEINGCGGIVYYDLTQLPCLGFQMYYFQCCWQCVSVITLPLLFSSLDFATLKLKLACFLRIPYHGIIIIIRGRTKFVYLFGQNNETMHASLSFLNFSILLYALLHTKVPPDQLVFKLSFKKVNLAYKRVIPA